MVAFEYGRRGPQAKECGWPLEVRNRPKLTATKEAGFYNHKKLNSANFLSKQGNGASPVTGKEHSLSIP